MLEEDVGAGLEYGLPVDYPPAMMPQQPKVVVSITKVDNGFMVKLLEPPKPKVTPEIRKPEDVNAVAKAEGIDIDKHIDDMIDGIGALMRTLNDKGAGESWKDGGEDKAKLRAGFKAMFPSLVRMGPQRLRVGQALRPRSESMVFGDKKALLEYVDKNL